MGRIAVLSLVLGALLPGTSCGPPAVDAALEAAGAPWEVYVTDPGAEPDQSKWRTDIFFPLR